MNENFNIKDLVDLVVDMIFDELRQKIVIDRERIEEEE